MKLTRRRGIVAAIVLSIVLLVAYVLRPRSIEVETGRVARRPLLVTVEAEGRTRVRDRFVVTAPITGQMRRLTLAEGDRVSGGQAVALIAPPPLDRALLDQARSRLDGAVALQGEATSQVHRARLAVTDAERSARRMRVLSEAGAVPARDRERAELTVGSSRDDLAAAEARVRAAAAEIRSARAAVAGASGNWSNATPVRSPVAGQVLRIPEASERTIAAGSPILELGDPADLEIVADFLSADALQVRPGARAEMRGGDGDTVLVGRVRAVRPSAFTRVSALGVEEQRVDVVVDPVSSLAELGDGYRLAVTVVVWSGGAVLSVPTSALVRNGGAWSVFVVEKGRARSRPVQVGRQGSTAAQVLDGLREGEEVILFPSDRIEDGVRVKRP